MVPCKSTAKEFSFEWSQHRISPTDSKVSTTLCVTIIDSIRTTQSPSVPQGYAEGVGICVTKHKFLAAKEKTRNVNHVSIQHFFFFFFVKKKKKTFSESSSEQLTPTKLAYKF